MGQCGELAVTKYQLDLASQDVFARRSYELAQRATQDKKFSTELAVVQVPQRKGDPKPVELDEEPFASPLEKMGQLRPAFEKTGTITAANASKEIVNLG